MIVRMLVMVPRTAHCGSVTVLIVWDVEMETGFSHLPVVNLNFGCVNRNEAGLNVFWLRDATLEESDNLPDPDVLAQEIVDDLEAALEQFPKITNDLSSK